MPHVMTVRGPVAATEIGFTLPHEHTRCVLWHIPNRWDYWELVGDEDRIVSELEPFREAGGSCLVDVTLDAIGRDPERLRRLSERSGVHIVMGSGWYREAYYPPEDRIDRRTVDDLADVLIQEAREGVRGTGIRPGIIGEIGTDKPWVSALEERVFRAAARASRETGLAVTTHAANSNVGVAQLRVLEDAGADPTRVIVGHTDSHPRLDYYLALIERGANIQFDFLGMTFTPLERHGEPRLIALLLELLGRGHVDRILFSQDVCHDSQLQSYGGNGYTYLQDAFLPRLREVGVTDGAIDQMTVLNPRQLLTID
jgi:phosphotriesterase-related protein